LVLAQVERCNRFSKPRALLQSSNDLPHFFRIKWPLIIRRLTGELISSTNLIIQASRASSTARRTAFRAALSSSRSSSVGIHEALQRFCASLRLFIAAMKVFVLGIYMFHFMMHGDKGLRVWADV